jgi:4-carboxymuconolactone decarboxylase
MVRSFAGAGSSAIVLLGVYASSRHPQLRVRTKGGCINVFATEGSMGNQQPNYFLKLKERFPDYIAAVEALGAKTHAAGPLDAKTLQLVQLGAASANRSEGAVHSRVRRARAAGATVDEIRHAIIAVTSTIGFPNVVAALTSADDVQDISPKPSP